MMRVPESSSRHTKTSPYRGPTVAPPAERSPLYSFGPLEVRSDPGKSCKSVATPFQSGKSVATAFQSGKFVATPFQSANPWVEGTPFQSG